MSKKIKIQKDKIYMLPIGGCGQFGANMTLYGYNGRWIVIDCGASFADEKMPGVDLLMPNIDNIPDDILDNIDGLFITHAHEDHVGGVPWLWADLGYPDIYCTPFAREVLKNKFSEHSHEEKVVFKDITPKQQINIPQNDIAVMPVTVSHSIPEAVSLFLQLPQATLLHSGDWNMDDSPVMPFETEEESFRKYAGDNGVLAYIGDSTNAENKGVSPSESGAAEGLLECFKEQRGRIVVTLFSSNISRIGSICKAAKACGRRVSAAGRSIETMIRSAKSVGYLQDIDNFIPIDEMGYLPEDEQVYIVTGSQGEFRATLSKVARGAHRHISLSAGDTVMFSARKIPGNERAIQDVMNDFMGAGVKVITPKEHHIHVSGHPYGGEINRMLDWVRPQIMIPVHGEKSQMSAQGRIGEEHQKKICMPNNGALIEIDPEKVTAKIICDYDCALRPVVFGRLEKAEYQPLKDRRKISFNGCAFVSAFVNEKSLELEELQLSTIGLLDMTQDEDQDAYEACMDDLEKAFYALKRSQRANAEAVEEALRLAVRRYFRKLMDAKPFTEIHALMGGA